MEEKYGEVEEMNVCDNLGDHLVGNVYVKVGVVGCGLWALMHQHASDVTLSRYPHLSGVFTPLHVT